MKRNKHKIFTGPNVQKYFIQHNIAWHPIKSFLDIIDKRICTEDGGCNVINKTMSKCRTHEIINNNQQQHEMQNDRCSNNKYCVIDGNKSYFDTTECLNYVDTKGGVSGDAQKDHAIKNLVLSLNEISRANVSLQSGLNGATMLRMYMPTYYYQPFRDKDNT